VIILQLSNAFKMLTKCLLCACQRLLKSLTNASEMLYKCFIKALQMLLKPLSVILQMHKKCLRFPMLVHYLSNALHMIYKSLINAWQMHSKLELILLGFANENEPSCETGLLNRRCQCSRHNIEHKPCQ